MDKISELESKSIFIIREAYSAIPQIFTLWSMGKDSSVLLWLIRKAFFGQVPFPVVHIDTTFKLPGMIEYRNATARQYNLDLRYAINEDAICQKVTFPDGAQTRIECCRLLKTKPLLDFQSGKGFQYKYDVTRDQFDKIPAQKFNGALIGLRSDEEGSRSKERYFSIRESNGSWHLADQAPELWNYFNLIAPKDSHFRVHPLLDWSELDIWNYIEREKIPAH